MSESHTIVFASGTAYCDECSEFAKDYVFPCKGLNTPQQCEVRDCTAFVVAYGMCGVCLDNDMAPDVDPEFLVMLDDEASDLKYVASAVMCNCTSCLKRSPEVNGLFTHHCTRCGRLFLTGDYNIIDCLGCSAQH